MAFTGAESHILALRAIGCSQSREETVPQSHDPGSWCISVMAWTMVEGYTVRDYYSGADRGGLP
jgi:hypothetical protein